MAPPRDPLEHLSLSSSLSRGTFWAWCVFVAINLWDIWKLGNDAVDLGVAVLLLAATAAWWVLGYRPELKLDPDGLTARNIVRDVRVPWPQVADADWVDVVRIHTPNDGPVRVWAIRVRVRSATREMTEAIRTSGMADQVDERAAQTRDRLDPTGRIGRKEFPGWVTATVLDRASRLRRTAPDGPVTTTTAPLAVGALVLSALLAIVGGVLIVG